MSDFVKGILCAGGLALFGKVCFRSGEIKQARKDGKVLKEISDDLTKIEEGLKSLLLEENDEDEEA